VGAEKKALRRANGQLTSRECALRPHRVGEIRRRADVQPWDIYPLHVSRPMYILASFNIFSARGSGCKAGLPAMPFPINRSCHIAVGALGTVLDNT
jgi:hypothetical protein